MDKLRILIADDHPLFRKGLRDLLASMPQVELVGEAATGEEAIELAESLQPDVVLMDLHMPGVGGLPAIRRIRQTSPRIRILVVTMFEDNDSVLEAMKAGALGYVLKDTPEEEMAAAIMAVSRGEGHYSPAIAVLIQNFFNAPRPVAPPDAFPQLTKQERATLQLMAQGMSNAEIADQLALSVKTVRNYTSNILSKLEVTNRVGAIIEAQKRGLGQ